MDPVRREDTLFEPSYSYNGTTFTHFKVGRLWTQKEAPPVPHRQPSDSPDGAVTYQLLRSCRHPPASDSRLRHMCKPAKIKHEPRATRM